MVGMHDLAVFAIGGTDEPVIVFTVTLDLEVVAAWLGIQDGYIIALK
jgi:hypothetical protein